MLCFSKAIGSWPGLIAERIFQLLHIPIYVLVEKPSYQILQFGSDVSAETGSNDLGRNSQAGCALPTRTAAIPCRPRLQAPAHHSNQSTSNLSTSKVHRE